VVRKFTAAPADSAVEKMLTPAGAGVRTPVRRLPDWARQYRDILHFRATLKEQP